MATFHAKPELTDGDGHAILYLRKDWTEWHFERQKGLAYIDL